MRPLAEYMMIPEDDGQIAFFVAAPPGLVPLEFNPAFINEVFDAAGVPAWDENAAFNEFLEAAQVDDDDAGEAPALPPELLELLDDASEEELAVQPAVVLEDCRLLRPIGDGMIFLVPSTVGSPGGRENSIAFPFFGGDSWVPRLSSDSVFSTVGYPEGSKGEPDATLNLIGETESPNGGFSAQYFPYTTSCKYMDDSIFGTVGYTEGSKGEPGTSLNVIGESEARTGGFSAQDIPYTTSRKRKDDGSKYDEEESHASKDRKLTSVTTTTGCHTVSETTKPSPTTTVTTTTITITTQTVTVDPCGVSNTLTQAILPTMPTFTQTHTVVHNV